MPSTRSHPPRRLASIRRANRRSAVRSRRRTFSYGIFDLITGLRYDTYTARGHLHRADLAIRLGLPRSGPIRWTVRRALQPQGHAGGPGAALAAALCHLLGSLPGADHQRDDVRRQPPWRRRQRSLPNPFLEPEIQKGWEFGANIRQDRCSRARLLPPEGRLLQMDVRTTSSPATSQRHPWASGSFFCNAPGTSSVRGRRGGGHVRRRATSSPA